MVISNFKSQITNKYKYFAILGMVSRRFHAAPGRGKPTRFVVSPIIFLIVIIIVIVIYIVIVIVFVMVIIIFIVVVIVIVIVIIPTRCVVSPTQFGRSRRQSMMRRQE